MKRIFALFLALMLLLSACGKDEPVGTTNGTQETTAPSVSESVSNGEGEGVLDPDTEIRYLIVKKIVTNDQGEELWGTEYTFNDKGQYLTLKQYIGGELIMDYGFAYTYDGNGNQVSMDEYLSGDLLHHVTFRYDESGREISSTTALVNGEIQSRTESQWDGLTETRFFYSGEETEPFMVSVFTYDDNGNVVFEETRQGDIVINRAEYIYEPFEVKK